MPFNRLNHSVLGTILPRFVLKINCDATDAIEHIQSKILVDPTVSVIRAKQLLFLKTPKHVQHYWSPEMTVRIEKSEYSGDTLVHCLIGPRQSVWAMFTLIYSAIFIATMFGGMFGIVQYQTTGSSPFIWFIPVGLTVLATVFVTSKIGQHKGRDQMLHLVSFLYHALDEIATVERTK